LPAAAQPPVSDGVLPREKMQNPAGGNDELAEIARFESGAAEGQSEPWILADFAPGVVYQFLVIPKQCGTGNGFLEEQSRDQDAEDHVLSAEAKLEAHEGDTLLSGLWTVPKGTQGSGRA